MRERKKIKSIMTDAKISREFAMEELERKKKYLRNLTLKRSAGIAEELTCGRMGREILRANRKFRERYG